MTKTQKNFENELINASAKNSIIADAISETIGYSFVNIPRLNRVGRLVVELGVEFNDGTQYRLRKSKYASNTSVVYVSDNMTDKMQDIASVSTSVLLNEYCQQRQTNKMSVCSKCFAENTVNQYRDLEKNLQVNTALLTTCIIPRELLPVFITDVVRFESFGDLNNVIQLINYIMIAVYNPTVWFTLWTKNAFLVRLVKRMGFTIPKNLHLIKSSQFINKPCDRDERDIFDATFTVYDANFLNEHSYNEKNFVNCGGRSCRGCMNCYGRKVKNAVINEKLK